MAYYSVCSLCIEAETLSSKFQPFLLQCDCIPPKVDMTIKRISKPYPKENAVKVVELSYLTVWQEAFNGNNRWIFEAINGFAIFYVDPNYSNVEYFFLDTFSFFGSQFRDNFLHPYIQFILQCKLVQNGYLVLHSACVEIEGHAFAFTGPSGIGKSTRAKKWCDLLSTQWISGDRPAIDVCHGMVYGVPWDGKESIFRNVSYPLSVVLNVRRSNDVRIQTMTVQEKTRLLCEQCFFPMWDIALASKCMDSIKKLIMNIPIFEFGCDISDDAMLIAHEKLLEKLKELGGKGL